MKRLRHPKTLALLLVLVIPGGFVLPVFYGLYGAIRYTLTPKAKPRSTAAPAEEAATPIKPEHDAPV